MGFLKKRDVSREGFEVWQYFYSFGRQAEAADIPAHQSDTASWVIFTKYHKEPYLT